MEDDEEDSDVVMAFPGRSHVTRALPAIPADRLAISWMTSIQSRRGKRASRRCCNKLFGPDAVRFSKESDFTLGSGRYFHLSCIPGGLHAQDTVQGEPARDVHVAAAIEAARESPTEAPSAGEQADRSSFVGDSPSDMQRGFAFWNSWDWATAFRLNYSTLIEVPKSLQSAFSERKSTIVSEIVQRSPDSTESLPFWRCLSMFDAFVLNSFRESEESQWEAVSRRLQLVDDGDWASLWQEAQIVRSSGPLARSDTSSAKKKRAALVQALAVHGEHGRAIKATQEPSEIMRDSTRVREVRALYPKSRAQNLSLPTPQAWDEDDLKSLAKQIRKNLRRSPLRTAPGPLGSRLEHWTVLKHSDSGLVDLSHLLARLAVGLAPEEMLEVHGKGEVMPSLKPDGGFRPVLMSSIMRRTCLKAVAQQEREAVQEFAGQTQLCFAKDGITKAHHAITFLTRTDHSRVLLSLDTSAAHQSFDRVSAASAIAQAAPHLSLPWASWYGRKNVHFWRSNDGVSHEVTSESGADQGDPIANLAYCCTVAQPLREAHRSISARDDGAQIFLFSDDIKVWVTPAQLEHAYTAISSALGQVGLSLRRDKTEIWCPSAGMELPQRFAEFRKTELKCLGARLVDGRRTGDPELPSVGGSADSSLNSAAERISAFAFRAEDLSDHGLSVQVAQALLRYVAHGAAQHIVSGTPVSTTAVIAYDAQVRSAWERVLRLRLSDSAWERAQLPLREGGLATGTLDGLLPRAAAAFAAAWSRTSDFVCGIAGYQSMTELLSRDGLLAAQLQAAGEKLHVAGLPLSRTPWHNHDVPAAFTQSRLLRKISSHARSEGISALSQTRATQWRSSSGPGSSGYLLVPMDAASVMDNVLFRISVARRFHGGLSARQGVGLVPRCAHSTPGGPCQGWLDIEGHHAVTCSRGGHPVRRHNRLVRWLARWLQDGRSEVDVRVEQSLLQQPPGRMDIVLGHGDSQTWIDVAIVTATSESQRTLQTRAGKDGHAARTEEQVKRRRYGPRVCPFVIEAGGRPGQSARSILMEYALPDEPSSVEIGNAWLAISCIVQAETSLAMLTAHGGSAALASGNTVIFIP